MPINKQSYKIIGMRQDNLVNTGVSNRYAHEIKNMRLNTVGDFTTGEWTSERGTKSITVEKELMPGSDQYYDWITNKSYHLYNEETGNYEVSDFKPIGQANINDTWVLFGIVQSKDQVPRELQGTKMDVIIALRYDNSHLYGRILYWSKHNTNPGEDLGFDFNHPIETLSFYENEDIQKVYWIDGLNQPRVINIKGAEDSQHGFDPNYPTRFDFAQEVSLNEEVEITKDVSGAGLFPPCTVKYVLTYYHKYGQESNIVYDSPLYYPIIGNRACSEDELSGDSFRIKVTNLDLNHGFDYIRLYSIVRTSENATPIVRIVADKPLADNPSEITFIDTNTTGQIIDPTILNYLGSKEIVAQTFDQKDNTLFLGNIELKTKSAKQVLKDKDLDPEHNLVFTDSEHGEGKTISIRPVWNDGTFYQYANQLTPAHPFDGSSFTNEWVNGNSQAIKTFRYGETYRFGIQFQDSKGVWSDVVYLKDMPQTNHPLTNSWDSRSIFSIAKYTLPSSIKQFLYTNGYRKARLVCCYPNNTDREIIAQGVLCPTVYNESERSEGQGAPYAMSSWFFRPNDDTNTVNYKLAWKHNKELTYMNVENYNGTVPDSEDKMSVGKGYYDKEGVEIQSVCPHFDDEDPTKDRTKSVYKVDRTVWTFNSPEIELDESIRTLPRDGFIIDVIGAIPNNNYASSYYLEASSPAVSYDGYKGSGFKSLPKVDTTGIGSHALNTGVWYDNDWYYRYMTRNNMYPLYPFQRKGSLSNYMRDLTFKGYSDGEAELKVTESSVLQTKVLSHLLYSNNILFSLNDYTLNNTPIDIFDSTEVLPIRFSKNNTDKIYYGNMNTIAPIEVLDADTEQSSSDYDVKNLYNVHSHDNARKPEEGNKFYGAYYLYEYGTNKSTIAAGNNPLQNIRRMAGVSSDPVPITYKSTPHVMFYSEDFIGIDGIDETFSLKSVQNTGLSQQVMSIINSNIINITRNNEIRILPQQPYLYLAEIRRLVSGAKFGGDPDTAHNIYTPCGPAERLDNEETGDIILKGYEGDHYFMRYDCLKTYPYATDDVNQIVEILSFMCETRINLDGRYDKNRGLTDNTIITNTNFNLINKSYSQSNNFFTFTVLDNLSAGLDNFSNQLTWTKPKTTGEDIDTWTNITLASTADAVGTLGAITKITNLNDRLYLFQEHGIALIGFNEKTAISTENGTPIELANTGKYTGLKYLSSNIGCQNKWSISNTKNGVFFIDDSRQELLALGEQILSLSTANGFDAFMINQLPKQFKTWNPVDFDNFVTYYDKISNDVYYINKNYCLAWNEQAKAFTSFYSYEHIPYMMNLGMHSLMWKDGVWAAREYDAYNTFFNNKEDYWITLACDGLTSDGNAFPADKVFNNVEYRADIYNEPFDTTPAPSKFNDSVFNIKHIWNGYQDSEECPLEGVRKFNTWRIQLPRHYGTRDRIRSPFCYIKLKQDQLKQNQTNRAILHDLTVYFDMK